MTERMDSGKQEEELVYKIDERLAERYGPVVMGGTRKLKNTFKSLDPYRIAGLCDRRILLEGARPPKEERTLSNLTKMNRLSELPCCSRTCKQEARSCSKHMSEKRGAGNEPEKKKQGDRDVIRRLAGRSYLAWSFGLDVAGP